MDLARAWSVAGPRVVATGFAVSGAVHLVRPQVFEPMIPSALPAPRTLVQVSGAAEIACAAGLIRGDRWAPWASAGLLLAVWPGNWQMALDVQRDRRRPAWQKAAAWARVPLQLPLVAAALAGRRPV